MADITHGGPRHRKSEFILYNGVRLFGTCGPNSAASALWAARNSQVLTSDVYALMRQYGWCDPSGASTLVGLNAAVKQMGGTVLDWVDWQASWPGWLAWFKQYAGKAAIIFETNNGQALIDSISGLGENAVGLVHHFVCVHIYHPGGWSDLFNANLPEGFGVADGDNLAGGNTNANNFDAADVLQFYPLAVLAACQPAGAIAVSVPGSVQGVPMGVPQGWTDDPANEKLSAPNGQSVVLGFRKFVLAQNWDPTNVPLEAERHIAPFVEHHNHGLGAAQRQVFLRSALRWDASGVAMFEDLGAELLACESEIAAGDATQIAQLQQQLAAANAQIATLQAQLNAAEGRIAAAKAALG